MSLSDIIDQFHENLEYRQLSPRTIETYRWSLGKLTKAHHELPQDRRSLKQLISQQDLSPHSKWDLWRDLRAFYRWLAAEDLGKDTMSQIAAALLPKTFPRTLEPTEISRLFRACSIRRDRALVALALDTGIRLGELAALR